MKRILFASIALLCLVTLATAQTTTHARETFSVWNVHAFEMGYPPEEQRTSYLLGVLTPEKPITIRRVEAISNRAP